MGDWPEYPLGAFVDPSRSICYGIVQPGNPHKDGVPIVRVNNFKDGRIDTRDALRINPETERTYQRSRLRGGELLLTLVGTMGLSAIVPNELRGWNVARAVGVVPLKENVDKRWLNFVLRSQPSQDFIQTHANTTVQATFNLRDLARLPIPMPPEDVRLPASELLSALDDKIEMNRRMNETLEAMAQALFKDWFVDFGPTRAKAEGRAPYLPAEVGDLFPDALDDEDEPLDWPRWTLADLAVHHRATVSPIAEPDRLFEHYSIPAYDTGQEPALDVGASIKSNKTIIPGGSILLSKLNPDIPRVWFPRSPNDSPQVASTEFLAFTPKPPAARSLLYCLFQDATFRREMDAMVTGTSKSHQRVSPKSLLQREVLCGDAGMFEMFDQKASPLLDRVLNNRAESCTLAETRDLLLPKLMSGEICLRDAEKAMEAVA